MSKKDMGMQRRSWPFALRVGPDPLRSDGDLLAAALKKAGVKVGHKIYDGVTHEFFGMAAVVKKARDAQAYAGQALKQSLGAASPK